MAVSRAVAVKKVASRKSIARTAGHPKSKPSLSQSVVNQRTPKGVSRAPGFDLGQEINAGLDKVFPTRKMGAGIKAAMHTPDNAVKRILRKQP